LAARRAALLFFFRLFAFFFVAPVLAVTASPYVALGPLLRALCDTAARVSPLSLSDT